MMMPNFCSIIDGNSAIEPNCRHQILIQCIRPLMIIERYETTARRARAPSTLTMTSIPPSCSASPSQQRSNLAGSNALSSEPWRLRREAPIPPLARGPWSHLLLGLDGPPFRVGAHGIISSDAILSPSSSKKY